MGQRSHKNVLFLCTGNYYRSRYAELVFNSVAGKMGLPWKAWSRGLAVRPGKNVGPMAREAVEALQGRGLQASAEWLRLPAQAAVEDLEKADWIVALKQTEHLPLLQERFTPWAEKVECWEIDDAPGVLGLIEAEVMDLAARLIAGGRPRSARAPDPVDFCHKCRQPAGTCACQKKKLASSGAVVRVGRETKGRRGKGVTIIADLPLDEAGLLELAGQLKQRCGTGGTVRDGRIEIQGDQRDRLVVELQGLGYRVKRMGG